MGCMLRSDEMTCCEMFIQIEAAYDVIAELGEKGCVQFEDMTPNASSSQRHYTAEMCRCTELERILVFIKGEIKKDKLVIPTPPDYPPAMKPDEINTIEALLEKWEENIMSTSRYQKKLLKNQLKLQEMYYVLKNIDPIVGHAEIRKDDILRRAAASGGDEMQGGKLHIFTGVVTRRQAYYFEVMIWRLFKGNIFFRPANEDELFLDPQTGVNVRKVAFLAVCQGELLKTHMEKVCAGFHVNTYDCPRTYNERQEMLKNLAQRISDLKHVISKTKYHRCKQFIQIGKQLEGWLIRVRKTKSIYYCMNLFNMDITRKCLIGMCWIPTRDLNLVQKVLDDGSQKAGSAVKSFMSKVTTIVTPPTFHRTNKFTKAFQNLISAYGDSKYRELNPGLYTIVTFPFLFALMFGDCGHATIMLLFALWMVIKEKKFMREKSTNEIWNIFFAGRYIILLMGLFSIYTGLVYNDCFSKPLSLRRSYWLNEFTQSQMETEHSLQFDPKMRTGSRYILGVDPLWALSKNKIVNENSLKMKMSIIIGVCHMMFGLWLGLVNHIYFKKYYAIILEFIPQLLILTCLFVWLVFMVFFKWIKYGAKATDIKLEPTCAPSILILFIDMCLLRETVVEEGSPCEPYMFSGQAFIQKILVFTALISIPILLFGSPVYIYLTNQGKREQVEDELDMYLSTKPMSDENEYDIVEEAYLQRINHYSESFGELMIHQGVHTIEYVLSTISHTASYLRLWALSLAHAQLSEMLWVMVLSKLGLQDRSYFGIAKLFLIFGAWEACSVSILVVMEGLSAFLHTLRLHWVEFMSKFYIGEGIIFYPFSFKVFLKGDNKFEKAMETACKKRKS